MKLSLCMIVRDNEDTIRPCIESILPWVDELVVVDTGSKDRTPDILRSYGAKLSYFDWIDDFSAARNESLRHASGEWIFWMDSDDTITPECGQKLRELADGAHDESTMGYVMQVHCPSGNGRNEFTVVDHVKMFRNREDLRFEGRIHEQVLMPIRKLGGEIVWTDIHVSHSGSDPSPESQRKKVERDLRILRKDLEERPDHPFILFNFAMTHAEMGDYEEALDWVTKCLSVSHPDESHVRKAFAYKVNCLFQLDRIDEAISACRHARQFYPEDIELLFREAMILQSTGQVLPSIERYKQILKLETAEEFRSTDPGIGGFKCRFNLALALGDADRLDESELQLRQVLTEIPDYLPALNSLGRMMIDRRRYAAAEVHAEQMQEHPETQMDGMLFQAKIAESRGEVILAQEYFQKCRKKYPENETVLDECSRFSFVNSDFEKAQQILQELVVLNPQNPSALYNLGLIYLQNQEADLAVELFNRSLSLRPQSAETLANLQAALDHRDSKATSSSSTAVDEKTINIDVRLSLGESAQLTQLLSIYRSRGYEVHVKCDQEHEFLFQGIGATIVQEADALVSWVEPPNFVAHSVVKPWHANKAGWNLPRIPLPHLGSPESIWQELFQNKQDIDVLSGSNEEVVGLSAHMPRPIVLLQLRSKQAVAGSPLHPKDLAKDLLESTEGSLFILDNGESIAELPNSERLHLVSELADNLTSEDLFALIVESDLLISDDPDSLFLAGLSNTPSVGIWPNTHDTVRLVVPRAELLNIVFEDEFEDHTRLWRIPWNIVTHSTESVDCRKISGHCISMLETTQYLPSNQIASDIQMRQWIDWCHEDLGKIRDRNRSFDWLFQEIRKRFQEPTILETGTIRADEDWAGAGFFTFLAGAYVYRQGGTLYSVDLDQKACSLAAENCLLFGESVKIVVGDSVSFLEKFEHPIDVLYLDSLDTYEPNFAEHALDEIQSAFPKLHENSIVVFDDSPTENGKVGGKGLLGVPWLIERGWRVGFSGYQVVLTRN